MLTFLHEAAYPRAYHRVIAFLGGVNVINYHPTTSFFITGHRFPVFEIHRHSLGETERDYRKCSLQGCRMPCIDPPPTSTSWLPVDSGQSRLLTQPVQIRGMDLFHATVQSNGPGVSGARRLLQKHMNEPDLEGIIMRQPHVHSVPFGLPSKLTGAKSKLASFYGPSHDKLIQ